MKLKIITAVSLVAFFIFMTSVFTAGLLRYAENNDKKEQDKLAVDNEAKINNDEVSSDNSVLSEAEIAKHNNKMDCWVLIDSNVYNLTGFISQHPGGSFLIEPYCGHDATSAFNTRDKKPPQQHSSFARGLLRSYYVGPLGKVPIDLAQTVPNIAPTIAVLPQPTKAPSPITVTTVASSQSLTLSMPEIATHNTLQNCWLIISGNVYDITRFISQHPGGVTAITDWCGKEATTAFQTRGGKGGTHSALANSMLGSYLIGSVGASVAVNTSTTSGTGTQTGGSGGTGITGFTIINTGCLQGMPQSICTKYGSSVVLIEGGSEDDGRWEGKVNTSAGCRAVKTNSSGAISSDEPC